jgi:hypothetical protein
MHSVPDGYITLIARIHPLVVFRRIQNIRSLNAQDLHWLTHEVSSCLPLPGGEGRGEGEHSLKFRRKNLPGGRVRV